MATAKRSFNFTPTRDYGTDWHAYFADYRKNIEEVNMEGKAETPNGAIEVTEKATEQTIADAVRSAKALANYAQELGFAVQVHTSGQRKFWRGEWLEESVWHVSGKKGSSAFHARWVAGKAVDAKVQVNGAEPQWVKVTEAKRLLLEAD